jgi:chorismate synthase
MASDRHSMMRAAIAAVRDCADTMETQATSLLQSLPTVAVSGELRPSALELTAGLKDASGRVTFELALLQAELADETAAAATAVKRLSAMDATMMAAVAALTDVVDQLEAAAERDEQYEPAFVMVIEVTGRLLQKLEKAKAATEALGAAMP